MRYLKYTSVDAVTGIPVTVEPARNGPVPPPVDGLEFGFALESEYPTLTPTYYGTAPDASGALVPGVIDFITEQEYDQAYADEMQARADKIPTPSYPQFTALEMLDLFTEAEQLAVVSATMAEPAVKLWYDRLIAATFVTYEDPRTEGGLQALVDAELLTPQRKAEIVAAMQPEGVAA